MVRIIAFLNILLQNMNRISSTQHKWNRRHKDSNLYQWEQAKRAHTQSSPSQSPVQSNSLQGCSLEHIKRNTGDTGVHSIY